MPSYTIIAEATVHLTVEADNPRKAVEMWNNWRAGRDHLNVADDAVVLLSDTSPKVLDSDMKQLDVQSA